MNTTIRYTNRMHFEDAAAIYRTGGLLRAIRAFLVIARNRLSA